MSLRLVVVEDEISSPIRTKVDNQPKGARVRLLHISLLIPVLLLAFLAPSAAANVTAPESTLQPDCGDSYDDQYLGDFPDENGNFFFRVTYRDMRQWLRMEDGTVASGHQTFVRADGATQGPYNASPSGGSIGMIVPTSAAGEWHVWVYRADDTLACSTSFTVYYQNFQEEVDTASKAGKLAA